MSEALQGFFEKYYSANIMTLAVLGPQGVDEMQSLVEGIFSAIPDKQIEMTFWNDTPYGEEELQRWIRIVPQSDTRSMYFIVPIPYGVPHYKTNVRFTEG
jgi:insulysin